jgi:hypothetical protein
MKTKIIPFDLETAKKIQAGEIKGRVLDRDNFEGIIVTTNGVNTPLPVVIKFSFANGDYILFFGTDGKSAKGNKLVLEVPDYEPRFKPFDKVLVRCSEYNYTCWQAAFYSHDTKDKNDDKHHVTTSGAYYMDNEILPYEGNEHLVGTTDKPKEE